jgi:hypothetical protein
MIKNWPPDSNAGSGGRSYLKMVMPVAPDVCYRCFEAGPEHGYISIALLSASLTAHPEKGLIGGEKKVSSRSNKS